MVLSSEEDTLLRKHTELCNKLNIDTDTSSDAWKSFEIMNKNFILEGEPLNWIACAIYVECYRLASSTGGQNSSQGNGVNFTNLLRHSTLSVAQFFTSIRNWSDMSRLPDPLLRRVENLESRYIVAYNVLQEFGPIFCKVFKQPEPLDPTQGKQQRNRKQKPVPCTPLKVFEFCWTLFITLKGQDASYTNDLVTLCHLVKVICDWAFKHALLGDRRDLLNPQFAGLPENWASPLYTPPTEAPCIIEHLCSDNNLLTDVKYIKVYLFQKSISKLLNDGVLSTKDDEKDGDVLDSSVFEKNFRNLTNTYETHLLIRGDFDEKIFVAEYRRTLLRQENQNNELVAANQSFGESTGSSESGREMGVGSEILTPLTGRRYLPNRDFHDNHGSAANTVARLQHILSGCAPSPSDSLVQLFESCTNDPTQKIEEILSNLSAKFLSGFPSEQARMSNNRVELAKTWFYKLIEGILRNERLLHSDISAILENVVFYECIFTCCLQIVMYSSNVSRRKFPWILDKLEIQPYNFVKVIELIIRSKDKLDRDTIKHLNMIEELILSSLIWRSDSIIWQAIANCDKEIPKYEETALPGQLQTETDSLTLRNILNSDPRHLQSPGPSATDRFQSPVNNTNRELFSNSQSNQSLTHLMINISGATRMIPIVSTPTNKEATPKRETPVPGRPRRTGGLSIIFRKFYNLAGERMEHLATQLKITCPDVKRKIWTAFEQLVRQNHCQIMKDRDLDQLLMCAVYMICKLVRSASRLNFAEIIKSYRTQPQATSDIYRDVLLEKENRLVDGNSVESFVKGDLIEFYNKVVVAAGMPLAQRFNEIGDRNSPGVQLSPLPVSRGQLVQVYGNICIKPLENHGTMLGSGKVLNYYFNRSPSKDLNDINKAIKGNGVIGKRLLADEDETLPPSKRIANRKVFTLIEERRNQNNE